MFYICKSDKQWRPSRGAPTRSITNSRRPDYPCNVIGGPILTSNDHEHSVDFKTSKLVIAATGRVVGTFDTPLMQLRLRGNPELDFTEEVTRHLRI